MIIEHLHVDGFGALRDVEIADLSEQINVLHGPNETGKTTLMNFIRSVFYGFTPGVRARYLPPARGGRAGGSLGVRGARGRFDVRRHDTEGGASEGSLHVTTADGRRHADHMLPALLAHVDEPIYRNVFAVGLRELQELATLSDTDAGRLLYDLAAGLDRVSLADVMRRLRKSRRKLLAEDGSECDIDHLLAERDRLRDELAKLEEIPRDYARLVHECGQVDREIASLKGQIDEAKARSLRIESAITVRDPWQQRASLRRRLKKLGDVVPVDEESIVELDTVVSRLQRRREQARQLKLQRQDVRRQIAALPINEQLWQHAPRIEALADTHDLLATLEAQIQDLQREITEAEGQMTKSRGQLGLEAGTSLDVVTALDDDTVASLRTHARGIRDAKQRLKEAEEKTGEFTEATQSLSSELGSALNRHPQGDLTRALDEAGERVTQLRHRVQLDERIERLTEQREDVEDDARDLLDTRLLPVGALVALGGVFCFGAMLLGLGMFWSGSMLTPLGGVITVVGLVAMVGAGVFKVVNERAMAQQQEAYERQLHLLARQIKQAEGERDALDAELPRGGGPLTMRLQKAEVELKSLEELLPVDARRISSEQEAGAAAQRAEQARAEIKAAEGRWRAALRKAGLPETLSPAAVKNLSSGREQVTQMNHQVNRRQQELLDRKMALESLAGRIHELIERVGVDLPPGQATVQLRQLEAEAGRQQQFVDQRNELRSRDRRLRGQQKKVVRSINKLRRREQTLLTESGAKDDAALRKMRQRYQRWEQLTAEEETLARQIAALLEARCDEDEIAELLADMDETALADHWDQLTTQQKQTEAALGQCFERRGQLAERMKTLAADRRTGEMRLELNTVEHRLDEAVGRWQVLAVASEMVDSLRHRYEKERQPETLQEASQYLQQMSRGRYRRVWTPLGDDVLLVDSTDGDAIPVEVLSDGAREQLFLSLRLALVSFYARNGTTLPLVMDDVLVNFDSDRALAAAEVLREFAAGGHQLLVFTCHEHIAAMFASLGVGVRDLLTGSVEQPESPDEPQEPPVRQRKTRRRTKKTTTRKSRKRKSLPKPAPEPEVVLEPEPPAVVAIAEPEPEPDVDEIQHWESIAREALLRSETSIEVEAVEEPEPIVEEPEVEPVVEEASVAEIEPAEEYDSLDEGLEYEWEASDDWDESDLEFAREAGFEPVETDEDDTDEAPYSDAA